METLVRFANNFMTAISLMTAVGVFIHDGRVDKAASTAFYGTHSIKTTAITNTEMIQRFRSFVDTDAHTHPDHNAAKASLLNNFAYQSPSVPPRNQEQKRQLSQELRARGHHAFDNALLPVIA